MLLPVSLALLAFSSSSLAAPAAHEVEALFKRQDNANMPQIGSAEWQAKYPATGTTPTSVPQLWTDALNAAVKAGKIPDIPPATMTEGIPSYSNGLQPTDPKVCHNTLGCSAPDDILDAPNGMLGVSHDDGPLPPGRRLNQFFADQKINATHFYIGGNVVGNTDIFLQARDIPGQHFAVHTWTHPYMSSLSNEGVVAELGWTMQILTDSNYGKIPAFWRPPYGDCDNRVRAIAKEVFGLTNVIWGPDNDSEDWHLTYSATEDSAVRAKVASVIAKPKSPGVIMLQHELSDRAVQIFIDYWPQYVSNGWDLRNIPDLFGMSWYKNSFSASTPNVDGITLVSLDGANATRPNANSASASASASASMGSASSAVAGASASGSAKAASASGSIKATGSALAGSASSAAAAASASAVGASSDGERALSRVALGVLGGVVGMVGCAWLL